MACFDSLGFVSLFSPSIKRPRYRIFKKHPASGNPPARQEEVLVQRPLSTSEAPKPAISVMQFPSNSPSAFQGEDTY